MKMDSLLHKKCTRVMKAMIPRKKTSKLKILENTSWNQEDDSCYVNITHFSMLDNELDGSLSLNKQKGDIFTISVDPFEILIFEALGSYKKSLSIFVLLTYL